MLQTERQEAIKLEQAIFELIKMFETTTGLEVQDDIEVHRLWVNTAGIPVDHSTLEHVHCDITLQH